MPYIFTLLGWWVLVFTGVGLLVLSEPLWNPRPARALARARDDRERCSRRS